MHYEPGNTRVLEYNLESASVRLKTTPVVLVGKAVEYTKAGPKLIDEELIQPPPSPPKPKRGRPKKRGGRGGATIASRTDEVTSPVRTRTGGRLKIATKPVVKLEPVSDEDTGSESPLSGAGGGSGDYGQSGGRCELELRLVTHVQARGIIWTGGCE